MLFFFTRHRRSFMYISVKGLPGPIDGEAGCDHAGTGEGCLSPIPQRKDWKMILKAVVVGLVVTFALVGIFGYLLQATPPPSDIYGR